MPFTVAMMFWAMAQRFCLNSCSVIRCLGNDSFLVVGFNTCDMGSVLARSTIGITIPVTCSPPLSFMTLVGQATRGSLVGVFLEKSGWLISMADSFSAIWPFGLRFSWYIFIARSGCCFTAYTSPSPPVPRTWATSMVVFLSLHLIVRPVCLPVFFVVIAGGLLPGPPGLWHRRDGWCGRPPATGTVPGPFGR